jgi:peptide/nickel transport system permease protein
LQDHPERVIWPGHGDLDHGAQRISMGDGLRDALDPRIRGR